MSFDADFRREVEAMIERQLRPVLDEREQLRARVKELEAETRTQAVRSTDRILSMLDEIEDLKAHAVDARKAALEEAARLVEMADLLWHLAPADPRARIALAIRDLANKPASKLRPVPVPTGVPGPGRPR